MPKAQTELEGFEEVQHKDLRDAAEEYQDIKEKRMALTDKEVPAKERLLKLMKKHNLKACSIDGYLISVEVEKETVKVKRKAGKKDD